MSFTHLFFCLKGYNETVLSPQSEKNIKQADGLRTVFGMIL